MADIHWLDDVPKRRTPQLRKATRARLPFLQLTLPELARLSEDKPTLPAIILFLEVIRLSGLHVVKERGGWATLDSPSLNSLGLSDKFVRYRAVTQLVILNYVFTRGHLGSKLEYRLNPHWAAPRPKARPKMVDLASARKVRS
jgi:hypothetical protein